MDGERLRALSRLSSRPRRARRVQRKVHVQPAGASRWLVRDAAQPHSAELPQLLPRGRALAIQRHPPGEGRMNANPSARELHASIRQTAASALLEGATLDAAVAEILRVLSFDLDWPLALYWIAAPDDRALHCRSIWAADALKRADVVEASRVAAIAEGAEEDR